MKPRWTESDLREAVQNARSIRQELGSLKFGTSWWQLLNGEKAHRALRTTHGPLQRLRLEQRYESGNQAEARFRRNPGEECLLQKLRVKAETLHCRVETTTT